MVYLWHSQNYSDIHMETIKQRIIGINKQSWLAALNESVRLESYKAYKKNIDQKYTWVI